MHESSRAFNWGSKERSGGRGRGNRERGKSQRRLKVEEGRERGKSQRRLKMKEGRERGRVKGD